MADAIDDDVALLGSLELLGGSHDVFLGEQRFHQAGVDPPAREVREFVG